MAPESGALMQHSKIARNPSIKSVLKTNANKMIIIHDTFVCKPGNASKLAKIFKEWAEVMPKKHNMRVMTDMTGQWHRVIMVSEFDSLAQYEEDTKNMMENQSEEEKKMMEKFKDMNEMYVSGSREIYKVW